MYLDVTKTKKSIIYLITIFYSLIIITSLKNYFSNLKLESQKDNGDIKYI